MKRKVLITGGAGFLGSNLLGYLQKIGDYEITIFDKLESNTTQNNSIHTHYFQGDINNKEDLEKVFTSYGPFQSVFHLAAIMPDKSAPDDILWETNVQGSVNVIEAAIQHKTSSLVFTSSNVTYGIPDNLPTTEETLLNPLEIYGRSKAKAEEELKKFKDKIAIQIIRCPVITGIGRLGLQGILFEFISENKNVYMLGDGSNIYQFADVLDVCSALEKASHAKGFEIYNIGSDGILSLKEVYQKVIDFAGSKSKIIGLPKTPSLFILAILDKLGISPLGIYQYTMLGRSLYTNTDKLKRKLKWNPQKTISDTFIENYIWYQKNKNSLSRLGQGGYSSNRSLPKLGAFKLLKLFS